MTINRFCSSGLQAIALGADAVAQRPARTWSSPGGIESMSLIPMSGHKLVAQPDAASSAIPDATSAWA